MDFDENEFRPETMPIIIMPNFQNKTLYLINGEFGAFEPGKPIKVPLWLATNFRKRQKCTIIAPYWMSIEKVNELIDEEKSSDQFNKMPNTNFMTLASILLNYAFDDISKADEIKELFAYLYHLRLTKLIKSMLECMKGNQ